MRQDPGHGAATASHVISRRATFVGLVAGLVLLGAVLAAREARPIPVDERWLFSPTELDEPAADVESSPSAEPAEPGENAVSELNMWTVVIVLATVAVVVAFFIRSLIGRGEPQDDVVAARPPRPAAAPGDPTGERLRQAVRHAEDVLSAAEPGDTGAAVIDAWLRLERAARDAGSGRHPAATPSEFTVALLAQHDADPAAVHTLLGLYHRARFSTAPLPTGAADEALTAVRTIAHSLGAPRAAGTAR